MTGRASPASIGDKGETPADGRCMTRPVGVTGRVGGRAQIGGNA